MVGTQDRLLIPAKFAATIGHLLATILASESDRMCLNSTGNDNGANDAAAFISFYVCFGINLLGLGLGLSITLLSWYQVIMHLIGSYLMTGYVLWCWNQHEESNIIWKIAGFANISTATFEVIVFASFLLNLKAAPRRF